MTDFPKILLVPVDGSKGAGKAAALAARLAEKLEVPVRLISAFPQDALEAFGVPVTTNVGQYKYFAPGAFEELREQTTSKAFKAAREAMGEVSVTVEEEIIPGEPAPAILEHASKVSDPMIVMGSRGLNRFSEVLIGSVSQRVLHHAECPVIVAR